MAVTYGNQPRHWSRLEHAAWTRRLALARLEAWEAELAGGRRPLTPQLAEAIRADRALVDRIDQELAEQEAPGLDLAGGLRLADAGQAVKGGADQGADCFRP